MNTNNCPGTALLLIIDEELYVFFTFIDDGLIIHYSLQKWTAQFPRTISKICQLPEFRIEFVTHLRSNRCYSVLKIAEKGKKSSHHWISQIFDNFFRRHYFCVARKFCPWVNIFFVHRPRCHFVNRVSDMCAMRKTKVKKCVIGRKFSTYFYYYFILITSFRLPQIRRPHRHLSGHAHFHWSMCTERNVHFVLEWPTNESQNSTQPFPNGDCILRVLWIRFRCSQKSRIFDSNLSHGNKFRLCEKGIYFPVNCVDFILIFSRILMWY